MTTASTIGERIRAVRLRTGLAQDRFATVLGYSRRALINWEQGTAEPPIGILAKLRRAFDVDPEWIVLGEDTSPQKQFGAMDWARLDRIEHDVDAAMFQVGIELKPAARTELIRGLYDDDSGADRTNAKQLRMMLRAIAQGKSADADQD